jgi:isopentenyl-diphosphate delta-isomerase
MTEYLVLVDGDDRRTGTDEKVRCHLPHGRLHRAFTALLFDADGRLVLARRSPTKMLWPGIWDGTFASHPRESETYVSSAERRMPEEMGAACKMDYLFKFEYHVPYMDVGSENEICGTVIGLVDRNERFGVDAGEISEVAMVSPGELLAGMREDAMAYCPWMLIALYLLPESDTGAQEKYGSILEEWSGPAMREQLAESIRKHIPDGNWRLVK